MAAFIVAVLAGPNMAYAQGGHDHASHGGQVQKIGPYEAELVVRGVDMTLYVLDENDRPVDASRFTATASVLARGNEQRQVELRPAGENRLTGQANFPVDGRFRAAITLRSSAGDDVGRARYTLDAAAR
jgi:nitrogen fixation protein FixH